MNLICWSKGCTHSGHCGPSRRHPGLPGAQFWGLHSHPILCKWTWFLKLWNILVHTVEVRKESKMWASQGKTASLLALSKAWNCASGPFRWNRGAAFIWAFNTTRHLLRAVLSTVWWGMQICMRNMYWSGGGGGIGEMGCNLLSSHDSATWLWFECANAEPAFCSLTTRPCPFPLHPPLLPQFLLF